MHTAREGSDHHGAGIYIKASHKGLLHKKLGVKEGEHIPSGKLKVHEGDSPALVKEKTFAKNARSWHKG